jgi:predicted transcriptional regulator
MSTITLELPPETERKLRERAEREGQTVEMLVRDLVMEVAEAVAPLRPRFISEPKLTDEEFKQWLADIAANEPGEPLPPDFSREDIYIDHD